jgi:serine/threonine protein kinase
VWAIGAMFYATLYGHLPFWADTEEEFIDQIVNAPLKFDADVPVSKECKNLIRGMLQKDPEKRSPLIDIMNENYFMIDDEDLELLIQKAQSDVEEQKL